MKTIVTCVGDALTCRLDMEGGSGSVPTLPSWVTAYVSGASDLIVITIDNPSTAGIYGPYDFGAFDVEIVVNENCFESVDPCCDGLERNIAFLNRWGGWQNWIFDGVTTFETQHRGNEKTFARSDNVVRYHDTGDVFDGEIVTTRDIGRNHVDLIVEMAMSIQAYLYNSNTGAFDIPILIERQSFTKYETRTNFFTINIRFIYATRKNYQIQ